MAIVNKKSDKSLLDDVPAGQEFWCKDGRVMKNMEELDEALKEMSDDTFKYHANKEKNDFSNWVRDCIGDVTLSRALARITTKATAIRKVDARLRSLEAIQ